MTSLFSLSRQHVVSLLLYYLCILKGVWVVCVDTELSLVFSEVHWWLSRPVVGSDDPSWQRGASQCGRVSVRLQGGSGLWGPGDSGLWNEGSTSENFILPHFRERQDTFTFSFSPSDVASTWAM